MRREWVYSHIETDFIFREITVKCCIFVRNIAGTEHYIFPGWPYRPTDGSSYTDYSYRHSVAEARGFCKLLLEIACLIFVAQAVYMYMVSQKSKSRLTRRTMLSTRSSTTGECIVRNPVGLLCSACYNIILCLHHSHDPNVDNRQLEMMRSKNVGLYWRKRE